MGSICPSGEQDDRYAALIYDETPSLYGSTHGGGESSSASPVSVVPRSANVVAVSPLKPKRDRTRSQTQLRSKLVSTSSSSSSSRDVRHSCLLLGAGESGKSTVLKQLRLLYENNQRQFSPSILNEFTHIIRHNMCEEMHILIEAMLEDSPEAYQGLVLELNVVRLQDASFISSSSSTSDQSAVMGAFEGQPPSAVVDCVRDNDSWMEGATGPAVRMLWMCDSIRQFYKAHKLDLQLPDCCAYFFQHAARISRKDYVPENKDILFARIRTSGVTEVNVEIKNARFKFVDMGGQRSERRKWHIKSKEPPTAIIFVGAINEYTHRLYEDEKVNRLLESINLFNEVCNHQSYENIPIILFLNKMDLFTRDWDANKFIKVFPEFANVHAMLKRKDKSASIQAASSFLEDMYLDCNVSPGRQVYRFFTQATDTDQVETISQSVRDIIVKKNLNASLGGSLF
jgi:guanine nucleotide-binding protein G(i) subunit alpha